MDAVEHELIYSTSHDLHKGYIHLIQVEKLQHDNYMTAEHMLRGRCSNTGGMKDNMRCRHTSHFLARAGAASSEWAEA
jgi:hypothetical protein